MIPGPQQLRRQQQYPGTPGSSSSEGADATKNKNKKRTRASKPKVRTGCITCKIRRVKCGEEKPACLRCTSTGRTCDGYDTEATAAKKLQTTTTSQLVHRSRGLLPVPPAVANHGISAQQHHYHLPSSSSVSIASSSNSPLPSPTSYGHFQQAATAAASFGLRVLRPSAPDIEGTETERRYFHDFRRVAEEGVSQHVANLDDFWQWTLPHMCLQDDSPLRHAVFALGAALRNYQDAECSGSIGNINPTNDTAVSASAPARAHATTQTTASQQTELFMLDQYGQAMALLGSADTNDPATITLTLVCCLAFVYIEALRSNWTAALRHLRAGLAIIDTMPVSDLVALADPKGRIVTSSSTWVGPMASDDVDYVLRTFASLECSACLYTDGFRPIIALKLYCARNLSEVTIPELGSIREAHRATQQFCRDVLALSWICGHNTGALRDDGIEGRSPRLMLAQLEVLLALGTQLEKRLIQLQEGPNAPKPWSLTYVSLLIDQLHFSCCRKLCEIFGRKFVPGFRAHDDDNGRGGGDTAAYARIVDLAEYIKRGVVSLSSTAQRGRWFMLDIGIVSPVHFVAYNCADRATRDRAVRVLRGWPRRENLWDAAEVGMLLREVPWAPPGLARSLSLGAAIPVLRARVAGEMGVEGGVDGDRVVGVEEEDGDGDGDGDGDAEGEPDDLEAAY